VAILSWSPLQLPGALISPRSRKE